MGIDRRIVHAVYGLACGRRKQIDKHIKCLLERLFTNSTMSSHFPGGVQDMTNFVASFLPASLSIVHANWNRDPRCKRDTFPADIKGQKQQKQKGLGLYGIS